MTLTRDERIRMERAHVDAWPALQTARIDGWLWRSSGGGSQRANSVSTVDFTGGDPLAALAMVEARYRALGAIARFQTFDETQPASLRDLLRARGYLPSDSTTTMFRRPDHAVAPRDIEKRDIAWPDWLDIYTAEITPNRREVNRQILSNVPTPRMFFACRRGGRIISTGLCVISQGCAVVQCVATRSGIRRQGGAQAVMAALEAWATAQKVDLLSLQVARTNTPAMRLYEKLGYEAGATNEFWVRNVMQTPG